MCTLQMTALVWKFIISSPQLLASYVPEVVYLSLMTGQIVFLRKRTPRSILSPRIHRVQVLFSYTRDMQSMPRSGHATLNLFR